MPTTEQQPDLFAPRPVPTAVPAATIAEKAPRVTNCDVARLVALLRGQGWLRAADLLRLDATMDDRAVRAIAEASAGAILSWPGSPGFRLYDEATEEERAHADAALTSQTEKMLARRDAYRARRRRLHTDRPQQP